MGNDHDTLAVTLADLIADVDLSIGSPRVISLPVIVLTVVDVLRERGLVDVERLSDWPGSAETS